MPLWQNSHLCRRLNRRSPFNLLEIWSDYRKSRIMGVFRNNPVIAVLISENEVTGYEYLFTSRPARPQ